MGQAAIGHLPQNIFLDIYIQHDSPGKDKESNWLPSPLDVFNLTLRMYVPHEIVLKGEYRIPAVQVVS